MFKYKWDGMQIAVVIFCAINIIALMVFPYKYSEIFDKTSYGYQSLIHWVLIIYSIRIVLHVFGLEIYNFNGHIIGLSVILVVDTYFHFLLGRRDGNMILYSGMLIPIVTHAIFVGIMYLDRLLYSIERR